MNSRREKAFHSFRGVRVFQPPAAVRLALKMQGRRKFFVSERNVQIKPEKTGRPRSVPAETHLPRWKLDEPAVRGGLRSDHGHRSFIELKETAALLVVCEYKVAADFRHSAFRPPQGLADLHLPAGAGRCEKTFGGRLAAAKKRE